MELKNKNSYKEKIVNFFKETDHLFPNSLSKRVNIQSWVNKLILKANIFIEKRDDKIIGLIAGYIDNAYENYSYITIFVVRKEWQGKGISKQLLNEYIKLCINKSLDYVVVEPYIINKRAIYFYKKNGFVNSGKCNEIKKDRLCFVYNISNECR